MHASIGSADLGFPIQQVGNRTRAEQDRSGAHPQAGLPLMRDNVDHATVDRANLEVVVPNRHLPGDFSLNVCLYVFGLTGLRHRHLVLLPVEEREHDRTSSNTLHFTGPIATFNSQP
jgi:hypothetical protein